MHSRTGRPRSEVVHQAILEATRDLVVELGYQGVTFEAIALRAGVSKVTLYRWWPSRAAIVAEAVAAGVLQTAERTLVYTGDVRSDLRAWIQAAVERLRDERTSGLSRALTAAAAERKTDAERLYERTVLPYRVEFMALLEQAAREGQLRPGVDLNVFADLILGVVVYNLVTHSRPSAGYEDCLSDAILYGACLPGEMPEPSLPMS